MRGRQANFSTAAQVGEAAAQEEPRRCRVLLPLPLSGAYDYLIPEGESVRPGDILTVPLGRREALGVVWDPLPEGESEDPLPLSKLKPIGPRLDAPPMREELRRFIDWVAAYTLSAPGAVLKMALSVPQALEPPSLQPVYRLAEEGERRLAEVRSTPARARLVEAARDGLARSASELAREAGVGSSVVKGLAEQGVLERLEIAPRPAFDAPDPDSQGPELSPDQAAASAALKRRLTEGFSVTLLDGVTGSGKTEVYLEAIAEALRSGKQVLVLLPEIALSLQVLERFAWRFGAAPAAWHSDLTQAQRRDTWRAVASGEARVVVGARSALFLPYRDLGLVIVDEEHEQAFKQEEGVCYHARDMAVVRARIEEAPLLLVSATPSLESLTNAEQGRYHELRLPDRHGGAALPKVEVIDLKKNRPQAIEQLGGAWLSEPLRTAVAETLARGEQALLFLNRRGFAPLTLCVECNHRLECPNCTALLVEHRLTNRLTCHLCGFSQRRPDACPKCGEEGSLIAWGPGVERVAEEARLLFPEARRLILSSDTLHGPKAAAEMLRMIREREVDLLIGTQIIAKGHHFPALTLVGVVDADLGLAGADLRGAERTYQLLHQVAGRAGREAQPGRVLLQTHEPRHPVIEALVSGERDRFMAAEAEARRQLMMPPFGRLAAVILSAPDVESVEQAARALARAAPREPGFQLLGPSVPPLAAVRGRHRRRFLLKTPKDRLPQAFLRAWLGRVKLPGKLRLQVDVDPYSFL